MRRTVTVLFIVLVLISVTGLFACKKASDNAPAPDNTGTSDNTGKPEPTVTYAFGTATISAEEGTVTARVNGDAPADLTKIAPGTSITVTATANAGFTFAGWYEGTTLVSAEATYTFTMPSKNFTLAPSFTRNSYALAYASEDNAKGTVTSTTASGSTVAYGASVTVTATANTGYIFTGWYEGTTKVSDNAAYTFTMPAAARTLTAKFIADQHVLIYSSDGRGITSGTTISGGLVDYGASVTVMATANTGYTFDGWYEGANKVSAEATYTFTMPDATYTLYARFNANRYTLAYTNEAVSGGATAGTLTGTLQNGSTADYGTSVTLTATAYEGYTFDGWYAGAEKVSAAAIYTFTLTGDTTLVGKFTVNRYALSCASENETKGTVTSTAGQDGTAAYNTPVTVTATANTGYTFAGWYEGTNKVSDEAVYAFAMPAAPRTLIARFTVNQYALTYASDDNAKGTVTSATASGSAVNYGTSVTVTAAANEGHTFAGWYEGENKVSDNAAYTFAMPAAARTLTAHFTVNQYTLTYSSEDTNKGTVASETASGSAVSYGTSVTVTAMANEGHTFAGWYEGANKVSDNAACTFTVTADRTLVAKFTINQYTLTYTSEDDAKGTVAGTATSGNTANYGTPVALTATANTGYTFDGWYAGDAKVSDNAAYAFTVTDDVTLVARFTVNQYVLTYASENDAKGTVTSAAASGDPVAYGASVTVTAEANEGYTFEGWYEGANKVSETAAYAFTMPAAARTLTARFTVNSYALTYASEDNGKGTVMGTAASGNTVNYGAAVALTAQAREGYDFDGWYEGEVRVSTEAAYAFAMPAAARTLTARFTAQPRTVCFYDGTDLIDEQTVDYGTRVNAPAPAKANYNFVGWYEDRTYDTLFDNRAITANINLYARWEQTVIYYDVTFLDWDDTQIGATQSVEQGKAAILPANPTRTGYDFAAWSADGSYAAVTQTLTVRATYTKKNYTVTFLWQEGGETYTTQTVAYLDTAVLPMTPARDDYIFAGWYTGDHAYDFTLRIDANITLYATWNVKPVDTFTVTFYDGTGEDKQAVDVQTVESGSAATAPAEPKKTGYRFLGWDKAFDVITADLEVYATYEAATYEVTFIYYTGAEAQESTQTVTHGAAAVPPANYQRTGYTFTGWNKTFDNVVSELTVTAQYSINSYTATYYNGDDVLTRNNAAYGSTFAVPDTPVVAGYSFIGWYADAGFNTEFDFTVPAAGNVPVYGKFELIELDTYTVDFIDYNGTVLSHQTVVAGAAAIDPGAPTRTGYTFAGWSKTFNNIQTNDEITATYTINRYTVTYLAEDRSSQLGVQTVDYGTDARALATAPVIAGKTFVRWSADISAVGRTLTVYAIYDTQVREVFFVEANGDEITTQTVRYGETASVPGTPTKAGYIFEGWYTDDTLTEAYDFNTPVTDAEGTYIYAKWEEANGVYSVYFRDYDGNSYGNVQRIVSGFTALEPSAPVKDGYTFAGWYLMSGQTPMLFDFDTPITTSITLYAVAQEP